ncbi:RWD-domain-containing protein [Testicularia cyperi]|uniref:RWD-domain-containing protein n=1 Tax=Testicularia cyperi TaxID=1882483 RepID=A0A317XRK2_9BASI|nr:RWD-domain-containing protein [Testicularia cyperi]
MPSQEEYEAILAEELEVLESIYIDELEKISQEELRIRVEPEEEVLPLLFALGVAPGEIPTESVEEGSPSPIELSLHINYTPEYPDAPPGMSIEVVRDSKGVLGPIVGADDDDEDEDEDDADSKKRKENAANAGRARLDELHQGLEEIAQDSLGMAMVFTLASHLRESLTTLIQRRVNEIEAEASAKREAEIEAEAEKFRGTAVTPERFAEWRIRFEAEMKEKERKQEETKMAKMSAKEREDYKKSKAKPSGKQLFEKGGTLEDEMDKDDDDGAQEVDWSLYTREQRERERREAEEQEELESRANGLAFEDNEDED